VGLTEGLPLGASAKTGEVLGCWPSAGSWMVQGLKFWPSVDAEIMIIACETKPKPTRQSVGGFVG
jgi:hypothetical protein